MCGSLPERGYSDDRGAGQSWSPCAGAHADTDSDSGSTGCAGPPARYRRVALAGGGAGLRRAGGGASRGSAFEGPGAAAATPGALISCRRRPRPRRLRRVGRWPARTSPPAGTLVSPGSADKWGRRFGYDCGDRWGALDNSDVLDLVAALLPPDGTVLDVGCGGSGSIWCMRTTPSTTSMHRRASPRKRGWCYIPAGCS